MFSDLESAIAAYETMCSAHALYVMKTSNEINELEIDYLKKLSDVGDENENLKRDSIKWKRVAQMVRWEMYKNRLDEHKM